MKFVKIGDKYYNTALIGWAMAKEFDGGTRYYIQFIGGAQQEITEEEFNSIIE